ncbi:MAG: hypothetical protein HYS21_13740 [Deltaproteobacteria bacterium]|nr:hypothetical protein [Deltaproteobacteria bacterium]
MSMDIEVIGLKEFDDAVESVRKTLVSEDMLIECAEAVKGNLLKRTSEARDKDGAAFEPYSKEYKKARRSKGRSAELVDLRMSGEMLRDISIKANGRAGEAVIYFENQESEKKALNLQETGTGKRKIKREFFELSEADAAEVLDSFTRHVDEVLKDAL